jgi:hypothetical protein
LPHRPRRLAIEAPAQIGDRAADRDDVVAFRSLVVLVGALLALGAGIVVQASARRRLAVRTMERRAEHWRQVGRIVARFCDGEPGSEIELRTALADRGWRELVVRALADAIRADPDLGRRFRGRDAELSLLRTWAAEQLSGDDETRREAAEVVGTLRMRSCIELLVVSLDGATADRTRETICRALVTLDPRTAVGVLLRLVGPDAPGWVGDLLAIAASRGSAASPWRRAVRDRVVDGETTPAVVRILDAPGRETAPALLSLLDSSDPAIRRLGLEVLVGSADLRPMADAVMRLIDDADPQVRISALRVVEASVGGVGRRRPRRGDRQGLVAVGSGAQVAWLTRLCALMGDEVRGVRYAAAAAVLALDPSGRALHAVADGEDPRASEVARVALLLDAGAKESNAG